MAKRRRAASEGASAQKGSRLLVVDDAEGIRTYLANLLELRGYQVDTAADGHAALALLEAGASPDVVILDVMMPGIDGIETLRRIRELDENVPVVMLSVIGRASTIVGAMQLGAVDYVNKPFDENELEATLTKWIERGRLEREREKLRVAVGDASRDAVWKSAAMQGVRDIIEQISDTNVTVLIHGESGVGKEIVAREVAPSQPLKHRACEWKSLHSNLSF